MDALPSLPLPKEALPDSVARFADPDSPTPKRAMAARGLVPLKGSDLVIALLQLAHDPDASVATSARATMSTLPEPLLSGACSAPLPAVFLDALVEHVQRNEEWLEQLVGNPQTADITIARLAKTCSERLGEQIALNQQRLLAAPEIIEALYKNRHVRMSTVDRLVELAARHQVELHGVHTFKAHVEAISGQLIPEPTEEPLPADEIFGLALAEDRDANSIDTDEKEGTESLREEFKPLFIRIKDMTLSEKLRLTLVGNGASRALLVRDPNRIVSRAAISSPQVTEHEATGYANSREVGEEVLRFIGTQRREWLSSYEIKRALIFNPKTPIGIGLKFLPHLFPADLRSLARSRGIPAALKTAAQQRIAKKKG